MHKKFTVIALSLVLLLGSASMALAGTYGPGEGGFLARDLAPEDRLQARLDRIDELVDAGRITAEQAETFKAAITERAEDCDCDGDCDGTGRDLAPEERLNIGFGRQGGTDEARGDAEGGARRGGGAMMRNADGANCPLDA